MSSELAVPASYLPRLTELAARLGRPVESLVVEALDRLLEDHAGDDSEEPGFDEVVFGAGEGAQTFSAAAFRQLPLRRQVGLLMLKAPRFYRAGKEIPREQAMSLASKAKA